MYTNAFAKKKNTKTLPSRIQHSGYRICETRCCIKIVLSLYKFACRRMQLCFQYILVFFPLIVILYNDFCTLTHTCKVKEIQKYEYPTMLKWLECTISLMKGRDIYWNKKVCLLTNFIQLYQQIHIWGKSICSFIILYTYFEKPMWSHVKNL